MLLLCGFLLWSILSIVMWAVFVETNAFDGRLEWLKLFLLLFVALPATAFLITLIICHSLVEAIQEKIKERRRIEASKYGVFERKVLFEKYCSHMWEHSSGFSVSAIKRFRCIKCKKKINMDIEEYHRMRNFGKIVNEPPLRQPYWYGGGYM